MSVTPPETDLRQRLIAALSTEFTDLGVTFAGDRLSAFLGQEGAVGAVYPGPSREKVGQVSVLEITAYVQLFLPWKVEVNPQQQVDPSTIESCAERLRRVCRVDDLAGPNSSHLWYYRCSDVEYPPDPTGNISRLVATVIADAQNPSLVATTG